MPENTRTALVTLSDQGLCLARALARETACDIFAHEQAGTLPGAVPFTRVMELTGTLFAQYSRIVFIAPVGVAVRALGPRLGHKTVDPAVVVVDMGGRWAVSLLSGHEGGANDLALEVSNILGCEPVITTSTEAGKDIIAGIGCRKGAVAPDIIHALNLALEKAGVLMSRVRLMSSADIKKNEAGLIEAAKVMDIPLYFVPGENIRNMPFELSGSKFVLDQVGLPGVAEPCALLAGRNTQLILGKTICKSVTIALARENFSWWE